VGLEYPPPPPRTTTGKTAGEHPTPPLTAIPPSHLDHGLLHQRLDEGVLGQQPRLQLPGSFCGGRGSFSSCARAHAWALLPSLVVCDAGQQGLAEAQGQLCRSLRASQRTGSRVRDWQRPRDSSAAACKGNGIERTGSRAVRERAPQDR
jgi:hypothetical protein